MKRRPFIRLAYLSAVLCFASFVVFGQTDTTQLTTAEHYNHILRLNAQQNYEQAMVECRKLIERAPHFWRTYQRLAMAAQLADRFAEAQDFLATQLARTPPHPATHIGLGIIHYLKKDFAAAIAEFKQCMVAMPEYDPSYFWLVLSYRDLKREAEAEEFFRTQVEARPNNAAARYGLGFHYFQYRKFDAALLEFNQATALEPRLSAAHLQKGIIFNSQDRYQEALAAFRQSAEVAESAGDEEAQRNALAQAGSMESRLGNYVRALETLNRTLELARRSGDLLQEERTLGSIGVIYHRQDNYQLAFFYYRQALAVSPMVKIGAIPHSHLGNVASLQYDLGNLPAALEAYRQVLAMEQTSKDEGYQAYVLNSLGRIYSDLGDRPQAAAHHERALAIGVRRSSPALQIGALSGLSAVYAQMGDYPKALAAIQQTLKTAQAMADPFAEGDMLSRLGALHMRLGNLAQAREAYLKMLAIEREKNSPRILWQAYAGLATVLQKLGQLDEARENYQRAIGLMENARAQLEVEEEKAGFFQDKTEVYKKLITLLLDLRDADAARHYDSESFQIAERARARAFLDLLAEAKISFDQGLDPDLLNRQQELQKQIAQLNSQLLKERAQEPAKQDQVKIVELEKGLSRADAEHRDWQNEVRRRNPRYADLKYPEPLTLAETQRLLDEQTVLLAYSLGEAGSFLFAVSRRDLLVARLPAAASIGQSVEKLLAAITDKNRPAANEYRRQAVELSKQLIQPASRLLTGKRELIIVPDGALHRLPFEVLLTSASAAQGDLRRLPYLVRSFAISYAPSASVLAGLRNESRAAAPKAFVAYADPAYEQNAETVIASTVRAASTGGRLSLNRLPHSRREAEGIAKLFGSGEADLFLGAAASEENVKVRDRLSQYRLVHFSTHGYVNEARPRFSGLVLSLPPAEKAGQSEDGLLSAYEIFNLKLNADLVVLSACDTGLGKEVKGEGLMSLMRAFMYAGTPSVMVSLWKVDDESAADLMIRFYRYRRQGVKQGKTTVKLNKAESLRRAQLDAIAQGDFPYYWAPFVLVGRP